MHPFLEKSCANETHPFIACLPAADRLRRPHHADTCTGDHHTHPESHGQPDCSHAAGHPGPACRHAAEGKDSYQTLVYDLTQANGMRWQVLNTLTPADLALAGPALKVVIALPPDPGLAALTAAAPGVQFLAVGIPDLPAASNLSTIGATGLPVDQQAFLAGYIAGLVAPEWKVGILSQKDTPGGTAAVTAFANGFTYYCGSCRNPLFPQPAGIYPVIVRIPTDAKPGEYTAYADLLLHNVVKVAYVYPGGCHAGAAELHGPEQNAADRPDPAR